MEVVLKRLEETGPPDDEEEEEEDEEEWAFVAILKEEGAGETTWGLVELDMLLCGGGGAKDMCEGG